jgi:hypothetical protein
MQQLSEPTGRRGREPGPLAGATALGAGRRCRAGGDGSDDGEGHRRSAGFSPGWDERIGGAGLMPFTSAARPGRIEERLRCDERITRQSSRLLATSSIVKVRVARRGERFRQALTHMCRAVLRRRSARNQKSRFLTEAALKRSQTWKAGTIRLRRLPRNLAPWPCRGRTSSGTWRDPPRSRADIRSTGGSGWSWRSGTAWIRSIWMRARIVKRDPRRFNNRVAESGKPFRSMCRLARECYRAHD